MAARTRWVAGSFLVVTIANGVAAASPVQVKVDAGLLEGSRFGTTPGGAFKGIPYAAAPAGDWRWKPPRPAPPWTGTRSAHALGPVCPQPDTWPRIRRRVATLLGGDPDLVPPPRPISEDCLSLNVWTPNLAGKAKLPVMVWLHGGGFTIGSGDDEAAALAPHGVVVVTLNYRLGLLGFLAHPALTRESEHASSGNYGLLDQLEALRWVQRNIAAFGGDPTRVTIFGHSSGADAVLQLLASPLARGLFQRAVAQSSAGGETLALARAEAQGVELAARLEAPTANPLPTLRAANLERLLSVAPGGFEAVTDGWLLPDAVPRLLAAEQPHAVPLVLGATANEWVILAQAFPPPKDRDGYRALLLQAGEARLERLLALYAPVDDDVLTVATRYLGDRNFVCPTRHVAVQRRTRTWLYLVSAPPALGPAGVRFAGFHGSDLRLLFGVDLGAPLGEVGERVGAAMRRYWVRFATTGDPNQPGLPEWPTYQGANPQHLELGDPIRVVAGLGRPGCDVLDEAQDEARAR